MSSPPDPKQPWRDKDTLIELYEEEGLSTRDVAEKLNCSRRTVTNWLYKTGVKTPKGNKPYHDKERFRQLYCEETLSTEDIADRWNCSELTVQRWAIRHNLSRGRVDIGSDTPWRDEDRLRELYCGLGLTNREVSEVLGCSHDCVHRWLKRFDVDIKNPKYRHWNEIERLRGDSELTTEKLAEDLEISIEVIERQNARYQREVVENRPAPQHKSPGSEQPWHDSDLLERLYSDEDYSVEQIADELGCSDSTVSRWLNVFGITYDEDRPWTNPENLEELYIREGLTSPEIAERFGCANSTIIRWLDRHDISKDDKPPLWHFEGILRTLYEEQEWSISEIAEELGSHKSTIRKWIKRHGIDTRGWGESPYRNEDVLRRLYKREQKSVIQIADKFGCTHATISYWLARHGIQTRTPDGVTHKVQELDVDEEKRPYENEDLLTQLYVNEDMSVSEISRELNCSDGVIRTYLDRFGISKPEQDDFALSELECEYPDETPWRSENLMRELYLRRELSTTQISELLDCSNATVSTWLSNHGIDTRRRYDRPSKLELKQMYSYDRKSGLRIANELGVSPSTVYRWLREAEIPIRDPSEYINPDLNDGQVLQQMYLDEEMSMAAIARELNAHPATVRESLLSHDIEIRDPTKEISGEKSPFWKGGKKPYGKGWTEQKREEVLTRDGYQCQYCGMEQESHLEKRGQSLHIHHIIPASRFDDPEKRNDISNLVAMCSSCHKKWEGIPLKPSLNQD